jgi:phage terminase large subunit GpA-like protein
MVANIKPKIISWNITLKKCPHCGEEINLDHTSYKSEKDMINNFFLRMNFHLKNQCFDEITPKINKVNVKTKESNLTTYEKVNLYF